MAWENHCLKVLFNLFHITFPRVSFLIFLFSLLFLFCHSSRLCSQCLAQLPEGPTASTATCPLLRAGRPWLCPLSLLKLSSLLFCLLLPLTHPFILLPSVTVHKQVDLINTGVPLLWTSASWQRLCLHCSKKWHKSFFFYMRFFLSDCSNYFVLSFSEQISRKINLSCKDLLVGLSKYAQSDSTCTHSTSVDTT